MSRKVILVTVVLAVVAGVLIYNSEAMREARFVKSLIARNLEARGGASAWSDVESLRMAGEMDIGQDMVVPYVIEQKRPGKMCFEFEFDAQKATQCTDGKTGWKVTPFQGRPDPQPMTDIELQETADTTDPYGLLYDYRARGFAIDYQGEMLIADRSIHKLEVTLPLGAVRWLYIDAETALEVNLETTRNVAGQNMLVETLYTEWQDVDGLLIPARQETKTEGDEISHFITVDSVTVNPIIDDDRFHIPVAASSGAGSSGTNAS